MAGMACPVQHRDEATHGVTKDNWLHDPDAVAERSHIVSTNLEAPARRVGPGGPAMAPQVEVDDLQVAGQPVEVRLEVGVVIATWPSVHEDDGGSLA